MRKLVEILVLIGVSLTLLLLGGCSTTRTVVKEVSVPVLVPCSITVPERPVFPLEEAKKSEDNIFVIVKKALSEIELRQGYETKLEASIKECNK